MNLANKIAIVTGGGSGMGRSTAILLAQKGVKVVICGRRNEALEETLKIIRSQGGEGVAIPTDIQDFKQVNNILNRVESQFGPINILVNNAGIAIAKPLLEIEEIEWDAMLNTNLKSVFMTCKIVIPSMMKTNGGVIVNVSSILGKKGIANFTAYSASKFGVIGLTQALAQECNSYHIRVYAVCPGRTATDMQQQLGGEEIAKLSMSPEKVAGKIIDLITETISLPSGSDLVIDEQSLQLILHDTSQQWKQQLQKFKLSVSQLKQFIKKQIS